MRDTIVKIGITLGLGIPFIALINMAIGAMVDSPNGSFQDHINSALLVAMFIPGGLLVGVIISVIWSK